MAAKTYIDAFDPEGRSRDICEKCGICLQLCPVLQMDKTQSQAEMGRLLRGEETERVLHECTFCFNCNRYCPNGLRPYALIMERAAEKNSKTGKEIPPSEFITHWKKFSGPLETNILFPWQIGQRNRRRFLSKK